MLAIIIKTILAIAAIFVIIIVFAVGTNSSEDKRKIRLEQERLAEYNMFGSINSIYNRVC